jgi:periplasmic protein TonB
MEAKKSKKANLENKKVIFIQIGLIISLAIVLQAFEFKTYEKPDIIIGNGNIEDIIDEITQITVQKVEPKIIAPKSITVINIVINETEGLDDIDITDEADENTRNEDWVPPIEEEVIDEAPLDFLKVESMPSFPGGEYERRKFLAENLKYPQMAKESGIQGKVYVSFVIEPDGSITNVEILRGIGGGCDEELVRVIKLMPKWIPGKQRGKAVRVQYNMPIKFTLQQQ